MLNNLGIMAGDSIKVFLPWTTTDELYRIELLNVLEKAGMKVFPESASPQDEESFKKEVENAIQQSDCSVHIITIGYGKTMISDPGLSYSKFQFQEAKRKLQLNPDYRMFIWYPHHMTGMQKEPMQEMFIRDIRYNIEGNMNFTNVASPIQLVEDVRSMMHHKEEEIFDVNETDIFVMFNELDEDQADEIVDLLSDIVDVEQLNIVQDNDFNYSEFCIKQIGVSKLAVVYFKETSSWALPFVQQVWKKAGGASSQTPILLIGDEDPDTNRGKAFNAPKMICMIIAGELIPLEIKVQYDKAAQI